MVPQRNVYGHTHGPFQQTYNCPRMLTAEAHNHSILRQLKMGWEGCKQKQEMLLCMKTWFWSPTSTSHIRTLGTILWRTFRMFQYVNLNSGNTLHTSYWLKTKYDQKQFTSIMRSFAFRTSWFALSVINSDVVSPVKATSGNLTVSVIYIPSQELILVQILSYRARGRWKTWV